MYSIKTVQSIDFTVFEYENVICIARIQRKRRKNNHFFLFFLADSLACSVKSSAWRFFFILRKDFRMTNHQTWAAYKCQTLQAAYTHAAKEWLETREKEEERERSCTSKEKPVIISKVFPAISAASQLIICFPFSLFLSRSLSCTSLHRHWFPVIVNFPFSFAFFSRSSHCLQPHRALLFPLPFVSTLCALAFDSGRWTKKMAREKSVQEK